MFKKTNIVAVLILILLLSITLLLVIKKDEESYPILASDIDSRAFENISTKKYSIPKHLPSVNMGDKSHVVKLRFIEPEFNVPAKKNEMIFSSSNFIPRSSLVIKAHELSVNWERPDVFSTVTKNIPILMNDFVSVIKTPLFWDESDYIKLGAIGLGTYLLTHLDDNIHSHSKENFDITNSTIFRGAELYGRTSTILYSALGFTLAGLASSEPELNLIGIELLEGFLIAENISNLLKYGFGRSRPYTNVGAGNLNAFKPIDNSQKSLPSGHTTLAFTLSTVLASHISNDYLKALIYTPAFLTGAQRIYSNSHWLSDVFLGAAIGYFVGSTITSLHTFDDENNILILGNARGELELIIPL